MLVLEFRGLYRSNARLGAYHRESRANTLACGLLGLGGDVWTWTTSQRDRGWTPSRVPSLSQAQVALSPSATPVTATGLDVRRASGSLAHGGGRAIYNFAVNRLPLPPTRRPLQALRQNRVGLDPWSTRTPMGSVRLVVAVRRDERREVPRHGDANAIIRPRLAALYDGEHGVKLMPRGAEIDHS
jgi:hypothetical protein